MLESSVLRSVKTIMRLVMLSRQGRQMTSFKPDVLGKGRVQKGANMAEADSHKMPVLNTFSEETNEATKLAAERSLSLGHSGDMKKRFAAAQTTSYRRRLCSSFADAATGVSVRLWVEAGFEACKIKVCIMR